MTMNLAICVLLGLLSTSYAYHILCMSPIPSRSHNILGKAVVDILLKEGYEVTWATAFPETVKKPMKNLHVIDVSVTKPISTAMNVSNIAKVNSAISVVRDFGFNISKAAAEVAALREVLIKTQFDAVITEWFFSDTDAGYAAIQRVPWILLSGTILFPQLEKLVDDVRTVPILPLFMHDYPVPMNFWQRLVNTFTYIMMEFGNWMYKPVSKGLYDTMFGPLAEARGVSLPDFDDAIYNVSVMLVNSHTSFAPSVAVPNNVFQIAGYHIDEHIEPLPKDLQELLDNSPQGVIYFSMGSNLKSSSLKAQTKKELVNIFANLPYTVLWKFEEQFEGLPKNVHIRPWMPQPSILAHPNVKVFITHGGLLSTLEALQYGVPLIAIPIFGDQPSNAARAVRSGYALKVTLSDDMAKDIKVALDEILNNDRYYKQAKYLSKLFRDRPVSPSKLVAHAVKTAIETKGADHLKSKAHLYAWYQRWMLDQIALLLGTIAVIFIIIRRVIKTIFIKKVRGTKEYKLKKK